MHVGAEHVGGHSIPSARHVRVEATADSLEVRVRAAPGAEHVLWLCPLAHGVVPHDTVHRVRRGKLKVTLFKAEKRQRWFALASTERKARPRAAAPEPEELDEMQMAALPKPVADRTDNVPAAALGAGPEGRAASSAPPAYAPPAPPAYAPGPPRERPSWVEDIHLDGAVVRVVVDRWTGLEDLSVEGDGGIARVERAGHPEPLVLEAGSRAAWSRKRRTLTLTAQ